MKKALKSTVFGVLVLDDELFDPPVYSAECEVTGHGTVRVTLVAAADQETDWKVMLSAAENALPLLIEHENKIREQAAAPVLELHQTSFPDEPRVASEKLLAALRLRHMNFFSDGYFELWYAGGEAFRFCDVRLRIDTEFRLVEVGIG